MSHTWDYRDSKLPTPKAREHAAAALGLLKDTQPGSYDARTQNMTTRAQVFATLALAETLAAIGEALQ